MNLSPQTLQLLFQLRLIWVGFMILSWLFWQWRKTSGAVFVSMLGLFLAGSYALVASSTQTMFWGMAGDESFIAAIFEHQAWGRLAADFSSHALPLFYPPLYFIIGGAVGIITHFNGIGIAKVMAIATLLIAPIIFYTLLRFWHKRDLTVEAAAITVALLMTALPFDATFLKPYEMLSGIALVITASGIVNAVWEQGRLSRNQWITAILTLGIIFCTFYFWFLLLAIAITAILIIGPKRKEMLATWVKLGITTLALSSWYWLPNVMSFVKFGYENWQPLFFVREDLNVFNPFSPVLSIFGAVIFCLAIFVMIRHRKLPQIKILTAFVLSAYLYLSINFISFYLHLRPMQPSKGFLFFAMPALILIASYGLQQLFKSSLKTVAPILIIIASLFTMPAIGLDSVKLVSQFDKNISYKFLGTPELNALFAIPDLRGKVLITSGMPELEARAPYQEYLTHNINLAHPALGFTLRHDFVTALTKSKNSDDFYQRLQSLPGQKIDALLLFHDKNNYYLYFWLDNFPDGGREEILKFDRSLIDSKYFEIMKTSDEFDLILMK